jgi:hypothetical protein
MNDLAAEALARWLENPDHRIYGHRQSFLDGFEAGVIAECERCAKVCEEVAEYASTVIVDEAERRSAQACAEAIRGSEL